MQKEVKVNFPLFFIFLLIRDIVPQELTLCQLPKINSTCDLKCKTPDLKKSISFIRQGKTFGSCTVISVKPKCDTSSTVSSIYQNASTNTTYFTIKYLDKDIHAGKWHCVYDNLQSETKVLRMYDIIIVSSDPIEVERDGVFHFPSNCLMPKPTAWLKCKNGDKQCRVSNFEKQNCQKLNLRRYNVTCETENCFSGNISKVKMQANGYITDEKIIIYNMKSTTTEYNHNSLDNQDSIILKVLLPTMAVIIIGISVLSLIYRKRLKEEMCTRMKKENKSTNSKNNENSRLQSLDT